MLLSVIRRMKMMMIFLFLLSQVCPLHAFSNARHVQVSQSTVPAGTMVPRAQRFATPKACQKDYVNTGDDNDERHICACNLPPCSCGDRE